jgi:hypothetical protein
MEKYTYPFSAFLNNKVAICRLIEEIQNNVIIATPLADRYIDTADDECNIWFTGALSAPEEAELAGNVVSNHTGECVREWTEAAFDPEMEPVEPGASKVIANDRPAIEIEDSITGFFSMMGVWSLEQMTHAELKATVKFIMKEVGVGTNVRIAMKAKAQATGEDSSDPFPYSGFVVVPIDYAIVGEVFEGVVSLSTPLFKENDALAIQVGRDGANSMGAGTNDDANVAIQIISAKLEAC